MQRRPYFIFYQDQVMSDANARRNLRKQDIKKVETKYRRQGEGKSTLSVHNKI